MLSFMRRVGLVMVAVVLLAAGYFGVKTFQLPGFIKLPGNIWGMRIEEALARKNCPDPPARTFPSTYYQGPMVDSHFHITSIPDWIVGGISEDDRQYAWLGPVITIDEIACLLKTEGTEKAFTFMNVWPAIERPSLEVAKRAVNRFPDLFVPFIQPPNDPSPMVEATVLQGMLGVYPRLFSGLGEIGNYGPIGPIVDPPPNDPLYLENYKLAREHNLMVYYHLGRGHQEEYEEVLGNNQDINFIFHGDTVTSVEQDVPRIVGEILRRHPNAFYTVDELYGNVWLLQEGVSKQEFIEHFENYESLIQVDLANWQDLIESYPDQVMWGTDRGDQPIWSYDQDVGLLLTDYARAFIGRLNPVVQERFAYKNAARLAEVSGRD